MKKLLVAGLLLGLESLSRRRRNAELARKRAQTWIGQAVRRLAKKPLGRRVPWWEQHEFLTSRVSPEMRYTTLDEIRDYANGECFSMAQDFRAKGEKFLVIVPEPFEVSGRLFPGALNAKRTPMVLGHRAPNWRFHVVTEGAGGVQDFYYPHLSGKNLSDYLEGAFHKEGPLLVFELPYLEERVSLLGLEYFSGKGYTRRPVWTRKGRHRATAAGLAWAINEGPAPSFGGSWILGRGELQLSPRELSRALRGGARLSPMLQRVDWSQPGAREWLRKFSLELKGDADALLCIAREQQRNPTA